ncbi:MAG: RND family transporter [Calditrichaceae bacterium]
MVNYLKGFYRKPVLVMTIVVILTALSFWQMGEHARVETNLDMYMPSEHPAFIYSDQAESWFNIKDAFIFVVENPDGLFTSGTLNKIKTITKKLQKMSQIEKDNVTSLYTLDNIVSSDYGMDVRPFFTKVPEDSAGLASIREAVTGNDMIMGRMVSNDETATIIVAELEGDVVFDKALYDQIQETAEEFRGPENIYFAGRPVVEGTLAQLAPEDMKKMIPIVLLVIVLVLLLTLRSFKSLIVTLFIVILSTIWAFGLMSALQIPIYAVSTMIPVMLIAIGVAYAIHLFNCLELFLKENPGASKEEALDNMIEVMWKPVLMAATTTAIGFISLITSQVWPVKYFGLFTAFGVLMALFLSIAFLPAMLYMVGLPKLKIKAAKTSEKEGLAGWITNAILNNSKTILVATVVIIVVSAFGMQKVWIDSSFLRNFEDDSEIVKADHFINSHFSGTTQFNVIFEGEDDTFKKPEVWRNVNILQEKLEAIPEVGNTSSMADYLRKMHKVMHGDSVKYDVIPESRDLLAQYLLLYTMAGDPKNLDKVVDYNYKRANLTVQLKGDNSKIIQKTIDLINNNKDLFPGITVNFAGSAYKGLVFTDLILQGQISSLLISIIMVVILLAFMFKSFSAGLIGSVPIIITSMISFAIMGFLDIPLGVTTALAASIAMGIGIDYAIHFIERYKIFSMETEDRLLVAIKTMGHTGRAIFFNALVLVLGFTVLLLSAFPPNQELGGLISLNMLLSFLCTIIVMLILIHIIKPKLIPKKGDV